MEQYRVILDLDDNDALARSKIDQLSATLAEVQRLKASVRAALEANDLQGARSSLQVAIGLVPSDDELLGWQAEVERRQSAADAEAALADDHRSPVVQDGLGSGRPHVVGSHPGVLVD